MRKPCSYDLGSQALVACCAVLAACTGRLLEPAGGDSTDTAGGPEGVGGGTSVTGTGGAAGMGGMGPVVVNPPPFQPAAGMLRRAIGRYRTTNHGPTIDPSARRRRARARGRRQHQPTVARCFVRKFYTYAVGHEERSVDGSVLNAIPNEI